MPHLMTRRLSILTALFASVFPQALRADDLDRDPINYSKTADDNPITRLQARILKGDAALKFDPKMGYLASVLKELGIAESSQCLVFSKTSLQRHRIGPRTPRALYFNDDVFIGYCHHGNVMEVTTVDPKLGAVFYTLDQQESPRPKFTRHDDSCLVCHASSQNHGYPGHLVRSVYADEDGLPILSSGSFRVDHTSPIKQRWGGWYVTGNSGKQVHLGNLIVRDRRQPEEIQLTANVNINDLSQFFKTNNYLTAHSDIVALMVMEHQSEMHNRLTRANFQTRQAVYDEAELNKALKRDDGYRSELTYRRIKSSGDPVVKYLLFSGEASLTEPIRGTTKFAEDFVKTAKRDSKGRSLRDMDLEKRLFKHPCSYMIYSIAFESLPTEVKDYVLRRLHQVLTGRDSSREFEHLSEADRRAILEILRETKPDLPAYWREDV
jgi:hypothetical protein